MRFYEVKSACKVGWLGSHPTLVLWFYSQLYNEKCGFQAAMIGSYKKNILILLMVLLAAAFPIVSQTIEDPIGDVSTGHPDYVDFEKVKFWQSSGQPDAMYIDFYTKGAIPKGNQAGIGATTIFEVYMDVDDNSNTGVKLEDIGYDYKLFANLYDWNGKNWIDGTVYWDYDASGSAHSLSGFYTFAEGNPRSTAPYRFRWEFSLIGLKWSRIKWIARTKYGVYWSDQIPDEGHAILEVDTTGVADIDTVRGEHIEFICPSTYKEVLERCDVIKAIDLGTQIQSQLCGTEFHGIQVIQYNPWMHGVASCGNPVDMGSWMWNDNPPWFVVFHELGHNYTLAADRFNNLYPALGYDTPMGGDNWDFGTNYVEAWASMVGLFAVHELFSKSGQYQLTTEGAASLEQGFNDQKNSFMGQLQGYEEDPNFHILTPDLLDGMFMSLGEEYGYEIFPRFFRILQPPDQSWDVLTVVKNNVRSNYDLSKTVAMTVTCCAFSVAAGADLRTQFRDQWDFPIDNEKYEEIKPEIEAMMMTGVDENPGLADKMQFRLYPNHPNPFNSSTIISYQIGQQSEVRIKIYDLLGNLVRIIDEGHRNAGDHHFIWDASNISSGIYIYSVETNQGVKAKKCVFLR